MNRAELFRTAKAGRLELRRVHYYGRTLEKIQADLDAGLTLDGPDRRAFEGGSFTTFRRVTKVSGDAFCLGNISWLSIPQASLLNITDKYVSGFTPALTPLTPEEQNVMAEWDKIANTKDYKEQAERDIMTDGSSTYWHRKSFFEKKGMAHLLGFDYKSGRKLNINAEGDESNIVYDKSVKGSEEFCYEYRVI